jgi:hypothetical protein
MQVQNYKKIAEMQSKHYNSGGFLISFNGQEKSTILF